MAGQLRKPVRKSLVASNAVITTGASSAFTLPVASSYHLYLNASAVTGTSPTGDFILQTSIDGGTTYVNLPMRSVQVTAAGCQHFVFRLGVNGADVATQTAAAATGGTLGKPIIPDLDFMKLAYTIGGTNPSITFSLTAIMQPADAV